MIVLRVSILLCVAAIGAAFALLTYGSGLSDNAQFIVFWLLGTCGGLLAALDYGIE